MRRRLGPGPVQRVQMTTEPFAAVRFLGLYNAVFIQSSEPGSHRESMRALVAVVCFQNRVTPMERGLQWPAVHRPASPLMNINQRRILTAAQTSECILSRVAIKNNLFLDWKIFRLPLSGGGKCLRGEGKKSKIKAGKSGLWKRIPGM